jgi:hypothetical protein
MVSRQSNLGPVCVCPMQALAVSFSKEEEVRCTSQPAVIAEVSEVHQHLRPGCLHVLSLAGHPPGPAHAPD